MLVLAVDYDLVVTLAVHGCLAAAGLRHVATWCETETMIAQGVREFCALYLARMWVALGVNVESCQQYCCCM